uniref:Plasmodium variant antigen protein Cir/Yir/Bir n=1 Tax=Strongyloides venezuelensis TaxID=75913 RepID=A0A0K0FR39_STRVS
MFRFLPCCSNLKGDVISTTVIKNKVEPEIDKNKEMKNEEKLQEKKEENENKLSESIPGSEAKDVPAKSVRQSGEQEADQVACNQKLAFVT